MSSKEVKNALKAAREAIRNKEFKEALKQCKAALAEDKNNYNALVFVGVAAEGLEQYDQALKAYHRAAQVSPEQLLAWQGLSSMHAKNPGQVPREDMVTVYEKLIQLYENDRDKQAESMRKLIIVYGDSDLDKALSLYDQLHDKQSVSDRDVVVSLVSRLQNQPSLTPQQESKLVSCLGLLLSSSQAGGGGDQASAADVDNYIRSYLPLLQKREADSVYEECRRLASAFPLCPLPQETQLRLLLDRQMDTTDPQEVQEIRQLTTQLTDLSQGEASPVVLLARGYLSLSEGKYLAARQALQEGVEKLSTCFCGLFFLCQVLYRLHATADYLHCCQLALSLQCSKSRVVSISTSSAVQQLHEMAVRCCLLQGNPSSLATALGHVGQLTEGREETDILRAHLYLELNDQDQLKGCLERLEGQSTTSLMALRAWLDFHQQRYADASDKLQKVVAEDASNAQYLLMYGRVLWEMRGEGGSGLQEQCFNTLLKAAKLDPYMSGTFLYLGHFYAELKKDQQRAKKCYQKAYDLDPGNEEAGAALCDVMAALGEEDSVQALLQKVTDTASAGCAKWAWLRVGLAQVRTGDPSTATISFQSALRADPSDSHVWECLAEAYLHRGSFTAALKAFAKAVELCPDSIYSLYQMASIKQRLGSLTEAVEEYSLLLNNAPDYVPALKGVGETYLLLEQRYLRQGLWGLAVDSCQQAITALTRAATHRPDLTCLWKLLGDCCTTLHPLPSSSFRIEVPGRLCQSGATENTVVMTKAALMELATKCYGRALKILPDSAPLWHDLGLGLFYLCREQGEGESRKEVVEKSVRALKKALTLDPSHHRHWTALGVVAASPYVQNLALAQHCFIKSVQCETNNAVAWTNLGTLYLRNDNIQLAHEAFKIAQSQDPEYVGSWVGQALVAETVGHEEAMDLFRHTTQLGIHTESCVGYGHWVVSTLLDVERQDSEAFQYCIHQMAAIPAAADALTRYTEVKKDDARAFNMLGLLLEHQGLFQSALTAFRRAAELGEKCGLTDDQQTRIQLNLARLLSQNQQYVEAGTVYQSCAESCADLCQWGLALYRAGRLQDSYGVYQKALSVAQTDRERSEVWAALGMVSYRAGNGEDAKSALFNSFQMSSPSLQGLLALCALGVLQRDVTLTQATLQELSGLVKSGDSLCDVALLTAAFKLSQGVGSEALDAVEGMMKDNPLTGLSLLMTRIALRCHSGHTALNSAPVTTQASHAKVKESLLCRTLAQLYVGQHSRGQAAENALTTAQKAFHCRPDDIGALCCLAAALHAEGVIQFVTKGDTALMTREVTLLDLALTSGKVTATQRSWCLQQKAVTQIMMDDLVGALGTLQQLQTEERSEVGSVLQCVVDGHLAGLEPLVLRDHTPLFFWQVLLCGLVREGRWQEGGVVVSEALQRAQGPSQGVKVVCLLTMGWLAAQQLLAGGGEGDDGDKLIGEVEEACQAVSTLSGQPYRLTQVLLALVHRPHNARKAKHHFSQALEAGRVRSVLGGEASVARRGLLTFLMDSGKDSDLLQQLLSEAEASGDMATMELYQRLTHA